MVAGLLALTILPLLKQLFKKNGYAVEAPVLFWLTSTHNHVTLLEV